MMSNDQRPTSVVSAPVAAAEQTIAAPAGELTKSVVGPERKKLWSAAEVWLLGAFSVIGLIGFIATFVLIMRRAPDAPVQRTLTPAEIQRLTGPAGERGPAGPAGPAGPRGATGDAAVRVVRGDCGTGNCIAECANDEVLLSAYCSPGRGPAIYPTETSALCRPIGRVRSDATAICVRARR
jgi:hypothetical protein